jgi:hypothetical protein
MEAVAWQEQQGQPSQAPLATLHFPNQISYRLRLAGAKSKYLVLETLNTS